MVPDEATVDVLDSLADVLTVDALTTAGVLTLPVPFLPDALTLVTLPDLALGLGDVPDVTAADLVAAALPDVLPDGTAVDVTTLPVTLPGLLPLPDEAADVTDKVLAAAVFFPIKLFNRFIEVLGLGDFFNKSLEFIP